MTEQIITQTSKKPLFKGCHIMVAEQSYIQIGEFRQIYRSKKNLFIWNTHPSRLVSKWMNCTVVYYMIKEDSEKEECYTCNVETFFGLLDHCEQIYDKLNSDK